MDVKVLNKQLPAMKAELAAVLKKYGLEMTKLTGSVGADDATIRITFMDQGGDKYAKFAKAFTSYAEIYGLKREWLNKTFKAPQGVFEIIGFDTKKRKKPVMLKLANGTIYYATEAQVAGAMTRATA